MCPTCKSTFVSPKLELSSCCSCGHIFQTNARVAAKYDVEYIAKYYQYPLRDLSLLRLGYMKAFSSRGTLVDIGYGTGDFVKLAIESGYDAYGHDLHGVDVGVRDVVPIPGTPWEVVTLFDSIEHFENLESVREIVRGAKTVIVSTPWTPSSFPDDRSWRHYKPGEHLHYFSPTSIIAMFAGWRILRIDNPEDAIRRGNEPNIMTAVFTR